MGRLKCDHIKRLITLTSDNIKRLSMYIARAKSGQQSSISFRDVFLTVVPNCYIFGDKGFSVATFVKKWWNYCLIVNRKPFLSNSYTLSPYLHLLSPHVVNGDKVEQFADWQDFVRLKVWSAWLKTLACWQKKNSLPPSLGHYSNS